MKKVEGPVLAAKEKKVRQSSSEKLEAIRQRLQGALAYRDLINSSDPATQEKLKKEFKKEFKTTYSDKLMDKLTTTESIEAEKLVSQAKDLIQQAVSDQSEEKRVESGVLHFDGYQDEAEKIDDERKAVVAGSIKKAGDVSGLKKVMDKVLKDYPYFEEKDLPNEINFSDEEAAIIAKAQFAKAAPVREDYEFSESDPSQAESEEVDIKKIRKQMSDQERVEKEAAGIKPKSTKNKTNNVAFTPEELAVINKAKNGGSHEEFFPESDPSQGNEDDIDIEDIKKQMSEQESLEIENASKEEKEEEDEYGEQTEQKTYDQMFAEASASVRKSIDDNVNTIKNNYEQEEAGASTEPSNETVPANASTNDVETPTTGDGGETNNNEGPKDNNNETAEKDLFNKDIMEKFRRLGLDNEHLKGIAGLQELDPVAQMTIATSLEVMALQRAEKEKSLLMAASLQGKNVVGKFFKNIGNAFQQGKYEKQALQNQLGIEKNGPALASLVKWAEDFHIGAFEYEKDGEKKTLLDFAKPFGEIGIPQEALVKFNQAASALANLPKHFQYQSGSFEENDVKKQHKEQYRAAKAAYEAAKKDIIENLQSQEVGDFALAKASLRADGMVSMMQNMAANPDFEKEWNKMAQGSSFIRSLLTKENAQYFAAGFASKWVFASMLGAIAVPMVAAGIGSIRALKRSRTELIKKDSLASTNDKSQNDLLEYRTHALRTLQKIVPEQYSMEPQKWLDEVASAEEKERYKFNKSEIEYSDKHLKRGVKNERKGVERKMLDAKELADRLDRELRIVDDKYRAGTYDISKLARRVRFTYESMDKGLVNYGNGPDRAGNMAQLMQTLQHCDGIVRMEGDNEKNQQLAEDIISRILERGQQKLSANRKKHLAMGMVRGAFMGATFAVAGRTVHTMFNNVVDSFLGQGWTSSHLSLGGLLHKVQGVRDQIFTGENSSFTHGGQSMESGANITDDASYSGASEAYEDQAEVNTAVNTSSSSEQAAEGTSNSSSSEGAVSNNVENNVEHTPSGNGSDPVRQAVEGASNSAEEDVVTNVVESNVNHAPSGNGGSDPVRQAVEGKTGSFSDSISNEKIKGTDSVWRSTKQIFLDNAEQLGYKGDMNDASSLSRWAEMNTNTALANSGDITDKVFEGNIVSLEKDGDEFVVSVEAGSGPQPDHLPIIEAETGAEEAVSAETEANGDSALDAAEEKFGVNAEDIKTMRGPEITAEIDGKEVTLNMETNEYSYFEGENEVCGQLEGSQTIYDVMDNGYDASDMGSEAPVESATDNTPPPTAEDIGKYIQKNRLLMSAVERRGEVLTQLEKATGIKNLENVLSRKESKALNDIIEKIDTRGLKAGSKDLNNFMEKVIKSHK